MRTYFNEFYFTVLVSSSTGALFQLSTNRRYRSVLRLHAESLSRRFRCSCRHEMKFLNDRPSCKVLRMRIEIAEKPNDQRDQKHADGDHNLLATEMCRHFVSNSTRTRILGILNEYRAKRPTASEN